MAKWKGESVGGKWHKNKTLLNEFWVYGILFCPFLPQSWPCVPFCFLFASLLLLSFPMPFWTGFVCYYILILFWIFLFCLWDGERCQGLTPVFMFGQCVVCPHDFPLSHVFSSAGKANSGAVIRNCSIPPSQQTRISNNRKLGRQITWANANPRLPPTSVQNLYNVSSSPTRKTQTNH